MISGLAGKKIVIVIPVFDDWESFGSLVEEIGRSVDFGLHKVSVVAVDDCSSNAADLSALNARRGKLSKVGLVRLASNLGPMRAIAVGLVVANETEDPDAVIVMDADGEDQPCDIARLLSEWDAGPQRIVVARRAERSEGQMFKFFYGVYKRAFRLLVGKSISFGNFCLLPREALSILVHTPAIWNNLPAAIIRSRIPYSQLDTKRGQRIAGKSSMNFVSLSVHGVSAISVFTDLVLLRLAVAMGVIAAATLLGLMIVIAIKFGTNWAIPGWASYVGGSLVIIFFQTVLFAVVMLIQVLSLRSLKTFLPILDARAFILSQQLNPNDNI